MRNAASRCARFEFTGAQLLCISKAIILTSAVSLGERPCSCRRWRLCYLKVVGSTAHSIDIRRKAYKVFPRFAARTRCACKRCCTSPAKRYGGYVLRESDGVQSADGISRIWYGTKQKFRSSFDTTQNCIRNSFHLYPIMSIEGLFGAFFSSLVVLASRSTKRPAISNMSKANIWRFVGAERVI